MANVGRPLKFKTPEELQTKIDAYFMSCYRTVTDEEGNMVNVNVRPLTITGLAVALETTRHTLLHYDEKDEYLHAIKKAKQIIENYAEENLFTNKNVAGVIFNMKNNWSWVDKTESDNTNTNKNLNIEMSDEERSSIIDKLKKDIETEKG